MLIVTIYIWESYHFLHPAKTSDNKVHLLLQTAHNIGYEGVPHRKGNDVQWFYKVNNLNKY